MWSNAGEGWRNQPRDRLPSGQDNFWVEYEWISPSRFGPSRPIYKPEFWDKIQELDQWTNKYDPVMTCQPLGLPRQGTPTRIIQTDKDIIILLSTVFRLRWRKHRIPRHPHGWSRAEPAAANVATYYGYSIGKWQGDTLVIDSINFDDSTWLGRGGLFHSGNMHIIEKLTRVGNETPIRHDDRRSGGVH